jgi:hypothetical protein
LVELMHELRITLGVAVGPEGITLGVAVGPDVGVPKGTVWGSALDEALDCGSGIRRR